MLAEMDLAALPFMFVCTFVCGFLLNTCNSNKRVAELEEKLDNLEWELSAATFKIKQLTETSDE
jgi:hypothetical protein